MHRAFRRSFCLLFVSSLWAAAPPAGAAESPHLSDQQVKTIREVIDGYSRAWISGDPKAVMALFTQDAVLLPPSHAPLEGHAAISAFNWPPETPPIKVTEFVLTPRQIQALDGGALAWSSYILAYENVAGYPGTRASAEGNVWMVLREDSPGTWKVTRQIWTSKPRK